MGSSPHVWFFVAKQRLLDWNKKSLWVPDITHRFVQAKQRYLHQNDKSIWFQTSSVFIFMQNCDFRNRIISLYGSQTSSVVLSTHNSVFSTDYMGSIPHVWFCACKSATLAHELLVSIGPSPHLWFSHAKQRLWNKHTSPYCYQT